MFKHSKCGRIVTAQYGFCPICYKDRLEPKPRKVLNKRDKEKEKEKEIMSRMSRGWRTDTRYVFTDKPTMPKGWVAVTRYELIDNPTVSEAHKPTMPKGWEDDTRYELIDKPTVSEAHKPTMPKGWETKPQ